MKKSKINHRRQITFKLIATAAFLFLATWTAVQAQDNKIENPLAAPEEVVLRWNRVLVETLAIPGQQPPTIFAARSYAILHAAMFDAVNSIDGGYTPYLTDVPGTKNASQEAAAAQAAHDVLAALYPTRQSVFDMELAASLEGIEENRARQGIRVGQTVAENILAARANDGWNGTPPPYVLPTTPGNWQPTPPANAPAAFTLYPTVTPFAIESATRFLPNPPPSLTSAEYTAAFNEVKEIGSATSATRTADQTLVARLWANVGTTTSSLQVWNNLARSLAVSRNLTTVETARLFALLYITFHDAFQTTFTSKYTYGLWRPIHAIRRADEDGNPNTTQDAAWNSLIVNPPYPTYAGNAAAHGMSQATILALFFGRDDIPFTANWAGTPGWTRSYPSLSAMADEQARSRIYGGIHFTFDSVAGQSAGRNVANYVFLNFMTPRRCNLSNISN